MQINLFQFLFSVFSCRHLYSTTGASQIYWDMRIRIPMYPNEIYCLGQRTTDAIQWFPGFTESYILYTTPKGHIVKVCCFKYPHLFIYLILLWRDEISVLLSTMQIFCKKNIIMPQNNHVPKDITQIPYIGKHRVRFTTFKSQVLFVLTQFLKKTHCILHYRLYSRKNMYFQ